LGDAEEDLDEIAAPLSNAKSGKFYSIRGIQRQGGVSANQTIHEQRWGWIPSNFVPGSQPSPIVDTSVCAGDGVIPAWSARLVSTPATNIRTVRGEIEDGFEHMDFLSLPSIQAEIGDIMGLPQVQAMMIQDPSGSTETPQPAGREEANEFLKELSGAEKATEALRRIGRFDLERIKAILRRLYIDAPKSPSQKRGELPKAVGAGDERDRERLDKGTPGAPPERSE
jgi:hypothetical protein